MLVRSSELLLTFTKSHLWRFYLSALIIHVIFSISFRFLLTDMASFGVNSTEIVFHSNCHCPLSVVICSATTGSRTIVHSNQNLPELTVEDLAKLPLGSYNWVHFEVSCTSLKNNSGLNYESSYIPKLIQSVCTAIFKRIAGPCFYLKSLMLYVNGFVSTSSTN